MVLLMFSGGSVFAADEVYLDLNPTDIWHFDTGKYMYENPKPDTDDEDENYVKPSFRTLKKMYDEDFGKAEKSGGADNTK